MYKKIIYLRLVGGLGNQLYQFSFAYKIFQKFRFNKIIVDCSAMKNYPENWGYLLNNVLDEKRLDQVVEFNGSWLHKFRIARLASILPLLSSSVGLISDGNVRGAQFDKLSTVWIDGYFENTLTVESDALNLSNLLRSDLYLELPYNLVVLNVRGGEFVRLGLSTDADFQVYGHYLKLVREKVESPVFHVVTDDIEYAKKLVAELDIEVIYHPSDPLENFKMLYSAHYKIISKSTFSEWACKLSPHRQNVFRI